MIQDERRFRVWLDDHVRRDDIHARADRPDMEIVALGDPGCLDDVLTDEAQGPYSVPKRWITRCTSAKRGHTLAGPLASSGRHALREGAISG